MTPPRAAIAATVAVCVGLGTVTVALAAGRSPTVPSPGRPKLVGIDYATWFPDKWHGRTWSAPADVPRGYDSASRRVIETHARELTGAGIDFVWVDWLNDIDCQYEVRAPGRRGTCDRDPGLAAQRAAEANTTALFDAYARADYPHPKISIFVGIDTPAALTDGRLTAKLDQIHHDYLDDPARRGEYLRWLGKPLVAVFLPAWHGPPPDFHDDRFTVRWLLGWIDDQPDKFDARTGEASPYWSFKDRSPTPVFPTWNRNPAASTPGHPVVEHVAVAAAYPGPRGWGSPGTRTRRGGTSCSDRFGVDGATLRRQFQRAIELDAQIVTIATFNEWAVEAPYYDERDPMCSLDVEPSAAFGDTYLRLVAQLVAAFKAGEPAVAISAKQSPDPGGISQVGESVVPTRLYRRLQRRGGGLGYEADDGAGGGGGTRRRRVRAERQR